MMAVAKHLSVGMLAAASHHAAAGSMVLDLAVAWEAAAVVDS